MQPLAARDTRGICSAREINQEPRACLVRCGRHLIAIHGIPNLDWSAARDRNVSHGRYAKFADNFPRKKPTCLTKHCGVGAPSCCQLCLGGVDNRVLLTVIGVRRHSGLIEQGGLERSDAITANWTLAHMVSIGTRRVFLLGTVAVLLSACAGKFRTYDGPPVTRLRIYKSQRLLFLDGETGPLKTYPIGLGFAPEGHKQFEGDGKTPEGSYVIDRRNPDSLYHLSIGISYPNEIDAAFAVEQGRSPGGDIFIHGGPRRGIEPLNVQDWTAGCIAVSDRQIEEVYSMVRDGTPIEIFP